MGSVVTFSGFNSIDFSSILSAMMAQERVPLTTLETEKSALETRATTYGTLIGKLSTLQSAVNRLSDASSLSGRSVSVSDSSMVSVSAGSSAPVGSHEITVSSLAASQVTASANSYADPDTAVVATGGSITIQTGSATPVVIEITVPKTLQGLADAINARDDLPVYASVVGAGDNYQLVLTARTPGLDSVFTVTNGLTTDGTHELIAFTDTDSDGVSGDSAADNARQASNASATVDGISISSPSNTLENAIAGSTLTLLKADPDAPVTVTVSEDTSTATANVKSFVSAYNDLLSFIDAQSESARNGTEGSIGRGGVTRQVRNQLRSILTTAQTGGAFEYLSQVGVESDRTGRLTLNESTLGSALTDDFEGVARLFAGETGIDGGVFGEISSRIGSFIDADGLILAERDRIDDQVTRLGDRIARMEEQLLVRQQSLQAEFIAADLAMTQLNSYTASLSSLGSEYRLF